MRRKLGSITWNDNGGCRIEVERGHTPDGKRRRLRKRFQNITEEEAELELLKMSRELGTDDNFDGRTTLHDYFFERFLYAPSVNGKERMPSTKAWYRDALRHNVLEQLGNKPIQRITHTDIVKAIQCSKSPTATKKALRAVMLAAYDDGLLDEKPFQRRIKTTASKREKVMPWTPSEARRALEAFREAPPEYEAWLILGLSGLRKSEALGVRPCDVETLEVVDPETGKTLEAMVIHVRRTYSEANGEREAVKNEASARIVPVIYSGRKRLAAILEGRDPSARVTHFSENTLNRNWRTLIQDFGLRYIPPKMLRHTSDTIALNAGVALDLNDKMHGRTEHGTTYRHYFNPDLGAMEKAARRIAI